ncbi:MAG: hypothetical protein WB612_04515 [Nitrososphaeraceae archaeon]
MHDGDSDIITLPVDADAIIKIARTSNADFSNEEEALVLSFSNAVDVFLYDFDNQSC